VLAVTMPVLSPAAERPRCPGYGQDGTTSPTQQMVS
jgi:hypothetical protein